MTTAATGTQTLQQKPTESRQLAVEFAADLVSTETLSGTPTVSVTNLRTLAAAGSELTVASITISGTTVTFQVTSTSAVPGTIYQFDVKCAGSISPNTKQALCLLEIIARG